MFPWFLDSDLGVDMEWLMVSCNMQSPAALRGICALAYLLFNPLATVWLVMEEFRCFSRCGFFLHANDLSL